MMKAQNDSVALFQDGNFEPRDQVGCPRGSKLLPGAVYATVSKFDRTWAFHHYEVRDQVGIVISFIQLD